MITTTPVAARDLDLPVLEDSPEDRATLTGQGPRGPDQVWT
jgi:hypothetical protein